MRPFGWVVTEEDWIGDDEDECEESWSSMLHLRTVSGSGSPDSVQGILAWGTGDSLAGYQVYALVLASR